MPQMRHRIGNDRASVGPGGLSGDTAAGGFTGPGAERHHYFIFLSR